MECCSWLSYEYHVTQGGEDGGQPPCCCRQQSRRHEQRPIRPLIEKAFLFQPAGG